MTIEDRIEHLQKSPMSRGFREFWLVWRLAAIIVFLLAMVLPYLTYILAAIYATFMVVEGWGIFRQGRGDTLSESRWLTGMKGLAYRIWSIGFAFMYVVGFGLLMMRLAPNAPWDALVMMWLALAAALSWLIPHFYCLGRHG